MMILRAAGAIQAEILLQFLLLGMMLCLLRDVLAILRRMFFVGQIAVNATDFLFFAVLTVTTYLSFLSTTNGSIRIYLLLCEGTGFLLWHFLLSRFYGLFLLRCAVQFHRILKKMIHGIKVLCCGFFWKTGSVMKKLFVFFRKIGLWLQNCLKNTCKKTSRGV